MGWECRDRQIRWCERLHVANLCAKELCVQEVPETILPEIVVCVCVGKNCVGQRFVCVCVCARTIIMMWGRVVCAPAYVCI